MLLFCDDELELDLNPASENFPTQMTLRDITKALLIVSCLIEPRKEK